MGDPQSGGHRPRIDPAPTRSVTSRAGFLRSQANALLSCDVIQTVTLTGQRQYSLAAIEHPTRRIRILGEAGIQVVLTEVRILRTNAIMQRWVQTRRRELLDRTPIWNERHLRHALHEFEQHYNTYRLHQALNQATPLRENCEPITDLGRIARVDIRRRDRLAGVIHEYRLAA